MSGKGGFYISETWAIMFVGLFMAAFVPLGSFVFLAAITWPLHWLGWFK